MNGMGVKTFPNGKKYIGKFKKGKYAGFGFLENAFVKGDKYFGQFKNGKF